MSKLNRFVLSHFSMILIAFFLLTDPALIAQPYDVGFRTVTFNDPNRNNREIQCEVYHPAETPGQDVPMASGHFSHIVFGHGFVMNVGAYESIASTLAEEGFIVLLPTTEGGLSPSHSNFAQDLAFVADEVIEESSDPGSFFYDHINERFAIGGHSMGGGSTYLSVQYLKNEVNTLFTFAAAETSPSAVDQMSGLNTSNLLFAGELDCVTPPVEHQIPMYNAQTGNDCKYYVEISGGYHCQFNDFNFNCNLGETFCSPAGGLNREDQIDLVLLILIPWLNSWLYQDCASWDSFEFLMEEEEGFEKNHQCDLTTVNDPLIEVQTPLPACPGEEVILEALETEGSILWSTGETDSTIGVTEAGDVSYTLSNEVCIKTSPSVTVEFVEAIETEILTPEGSNFCPGEELILTAFPATGSVVWSTGETTQSIAVDQVGFYNFSLIVSGCIFESDEIFISEVQDPMFEVIAPLGRVLCKGESLPLFVSQAADEVNWNTGETGFDIEVNQEGEYYYEAMEENCIFQSEKLLVVLDFPGPLMVEPEGDPVICPGDSLKLDSGPFTGDLLWSNGLSTNEIHVFESGTYYYQAFTENCIYQSDSLEVEILDLPNPQVIAGGLMNLCPGDSLVLSASTTAGDFQWNTGSTSLDLLVFDPGDYYFTIDTSGCFLSSDTVSITAEEDFQPLVLHPEGVTICQGEGVVLMSSAGGLEVIWSTLDTAVQIKAESPGSYYYHIEQGNCLFYSDTIQVLEAPVIRPSVDTESGNTLCPDGQMELSINVDYPPTWNTGDTLRAITIETPGTYYYTFEAYNCIYISDSIVIGQVDEIDYQLITEDMKQYCPGDTALLIAYSESGTINWSDGSTNDSLRVNESGNYYFEVSHEGCIFFSDTTAVGFLTDWDIEKIEGPDTIFKEVIYYFEVPPIPELDYWWSGEFIEIVGPANRNFVEVMISTDQLLDSIELNLFVSDSICKEDELSKTLYVDRLNTLSQQLEWKVVISHHHNSWRIQTYAGISDWQLLITDVTGRLVHKQHSNNTSVLEYFHDHLPQGVYFISLRTEGKRDLVEKVMKF